MKYVYWSLAAMFFSFAASGIGVTLDSACAADSVDAATVSLIDEAKSIEARVKLYGNQIVEMPDRQLPRAIPHACQQLVVEANHLFVNRSLYEKELDAIVSSPLEDGATKFEAAAVLFGADEKGRYLKGLIGTGAACLSSGGTPQEQRQYVIKLAMEITAEATAQAKITQRMKDECGRRGADCSTWEVDARLQPWEDTFPSGFFLNYVWCRLDGFSHCKCMGKAGCPDA
ncbi:MAG: hypothetical protein HY459_02540 [Parcubacteria group bacterium]|nr:hypothetical protein [Parcubacteria group bacterium]